MTRPDALIEQAHEPQRCECGHAVGDHQSAGTVWPHPPRYGFCFVCDCKAFSGVTQPEERAA